MLQQPWNDKISNPAQIGGIETAVLDNGLGRGTRFAWINTGTGLRYKVVIDRAMDIADAFYNQHSLAWLSHVGITPPQPFSLKGIDWIKTFGGGLLTTCGLTHVGGPEADEHGERSLHGRISNLPAEIESIVQPDPLAGNMDMSISGRIKQTQVFGPSLELKRTISGTLGKASIRIKDEVINRGNTPAPHMLLYHFNLGWPLVDEGSQLLWQGDWESREGESAKIFKEGHDFRSCPPPLEEHKGGGEEAAFINISADSSGVSTCGIHNPQLGLALALRFQKKQLPWLTNWQHWGKGEYVTGLEPGTNPPIGQAKAREMETLLHLAPGESKKYALEIEIFDNEERIKEFIQPYNLG
ncbi:aldose 1-epimerase family protein [Catalinimonas niigatensis]|uniref:aldose 1-epimerase family protein n=1 Tax=Catalinimonas niigatensis TaxID=1397264 RepID=UPI002666841C|nr:aldose 1-epimerase family protein [Catalinimonas niigatensis]WPP50339.1 aldose 1-epimerase family protein [Catalinimonas niigatensis]